VRHDPRYFIDIGSRFVQQSHASEVIRYDPSFRYASDPTGYDGQFVYYIALDPLNARYYLDSPAYRYTRILYPLTARLLAVGQAGLVPYAMIVINWLAVGLSAGALAAWLKRHRLSALLALVYAFYAGVLIALRYDLTEILSFALVIAAIYLFDVRRWRFRAAGLFALAGLARETALIFALIYGLSLLRPAEGGVQARSLTARARQSALFLGISLLPAAAWRLFLSFELGAAGVPPGPVLQPVPFLGVLHYWPLHFRQLEEIVVVMIPGLICGAIAVFAITRGVGSKELAALITQVLLFVVFIHPFAFPDLTASARYTIGIVIAAICSIPMVDRVTAGRRTWLLLCALCWLLPTPWYLAKPFLVVGA
jgi:hypothetical protein